MQSENPNLAISLQQKTGCFYYRVVTLVAGDSGYEEVYFGIRG